MPRIAVLNNTFIKAGLNQIPWINPTSPAAPLNAILIIPALTIYNRLIIL